MITSVNMSSMKEELLQLNDHLNRYIAVEETVLGQKLGSQVAYKGLITELSQLLNEIEEQNTRFGRYEELSKEEASDLQLYVSALMNTIAALLTITNGLRVKADKSGKYGFIEYQKDLRRYKKLRRRYQSQGAVLNQVFEKL